MNNTSALWYFESVNLYKILCPHKVKTMADKHTYNIYKKDEFIYFPDDQATHIYMIVSGRVRIGHYQDDGKDIVTAILSTDEIFGELALAGEKKRLRSGHGCKHHHLPLKFNGTKRINV